MRLFVLIASFLLLVGCTKIVPYYKPDIQQGNLLNPKLISQLKPGMSKNDVIDLLGNPVLDNSLNSNQMIYIYTNKPNKKPYEQKQVILYFSGDKLSRIEK